jgi:hypothetical protein
MPADSQIHSRRQQLLQSDGAAPAVVWVTRKVWRLLPAAVKHWVLDLQPRAMLPLAPRFKNAHPQSMPQAKL